MNISLQNHRTALFLLLLTLLLSSDNVYAQSSGTTFASTIVDLGNSIVTTMLDTGQSVNAALTTIAHTLMKYLVVILIAYSFSIYLLKSDSINELFVQLFILIIAYNLAKFMMSPEVSLAIRNFFEQVASLINPGLSTSSPGSFLLTIIQAAFRPVEVIYSSPAWTERNFLSTDFLSMLVLLAALGFTFIAGVFATILILFTFIMAEFMFMLAIGLAPIFVFSLAIPFLSWLFDGWLRFIISACGFKVIIAFISLIASLIAEKITATTISSTADDLSVMTPQLGILVALQMLLAFLFFLVPMIAPQLFGAGSKLSFGLNPLATAFKGGGGNSPAVAGKSAVQAFNLGKSGVSGGIKGLKMGASASRSVSNAASSLSKGISTAAGFNK